MNSGEQRELQLRIEDADGIEALDLALAYDPAWIAIEAVRKVDLGARLVAMSHDTGGVVEVGMYGILPLEGSGTLLSITVRAHQDLGFELPVRVKGVANEALIPIRVVDPRFESKRGPAQIGNRPDRSGRR